MDHSLPIVIGSLAFLIEELVAGLFVIRGSTILVSEWSWLRWYHKYGIIAGSAGSLLFIYAQVSELEYIYNGTYTLTDVIQWDATEILIVSGMLFLLIALPESKMKPDEND